MRSAQTIRAFMAKLDRFLELHKPYKDETEEARKVLGLETSLIDDHFNDEQCALRMKHLLS